MTDEKLGTLLEAFANFYWSVPVAFVVEKIAVWYPEIDAKQAGRVLHRCGKNIFWHHCSVETDRVEEAELVVEHMIALGGNTYDQFLASRIDRPFCEYDEETLLCFTDYRQLPQLNLPEIKAISDFGKTELELDDEWAKQLINDCAFCQPSALCDGRSWVMSALAQEQFGKIHFRTIEQVKRFRTLGNDLYRVLPNPVLRGWKPIEIDNPPVPPDGIPERDEDIPDGREAINKIFSPYGGREKFTELFTQQLEEVTIPKRKIGRNELCPCGSGKKYKKCCGR